MLYQGITDMHEVFLVPKDKSSSPFPCFAVEPYGAGGGDSNSERYSGWCGTCVRDAKENGNHNLSSMTLTIDHLESLATVAQPLGENLTLSVSLPG